MNWGQLGKSASAVIRANGMKLTVTRETGGYADGVAGERVGSVQQTWTFYAVKSSMGANAASAKVSAKAATLIAAGAVLLIAEVIPGYEPAPGDILKASRSGTQWTLELAEPVDPGDVAVITKLVARKQ